MRLVTRSDFDGLACGALLLKVGVIDSWKFAHPKDLQDGLIEITVENSQGHTLPSTGGIGTTIFYILGGVLAVGAVVLLITKKRMASAE